MVAKRGNFVKEMGDIDAEAAEEPKRLQLEELRSLRLSIEGDRALFLLPLLFPMLLSF